jgi:hypothetical protein
VCTPSQLSSPSFFVISLIPLLPYLLYTSLTYSLDWMNSGSIFHCSPLSAGVVLPKRKVSFLCSTASRPLNDCQIFKGGSASHLSGWRNHFFSVSDYAGYQKRVLCFELTVPVSVRDRRRVPSVLQSDLLKIRIKCVILQLGKSGYQFMLCGISRGPTYSGATV